MTFCRRCRGEGWILIEEHLGDGVYSAVDETPCPRCKGSGKEPAP